MATRGWKLLAAACGAVFLAASASAQAPDRSPLPVPRPVQLPVATAATGTATLPAAQTGAVLGLSVDPSGALIRSPMPAPRPAFDSVQLPDSMVPQRPSTTQASPLAPAESEGERGDPVSIAAVIPDTTPLAQSAPAALAAAARPRQMPRPMPRPHGLPATLPGTPIPDTTTPVVQLPPPPGVEAAVAAAIAQDAVATNPLAPARSLHPLRRSPAALSRHTQAVRRAAQVTTPVAAGAGSTARVSGGLCGVATLEGRPLPRISSATRGCGIAEPVSVTAVAGIRLSHPATLDCDTARAFDRWVRQAMQPAFGRGGGGVTQIRVAAHYSCRPRNNRAGARISEHGRGRAIDISGFRLANGQSVMVLRDWRRGPHSQALRQMHANACGIFRTTLGPGSDGYHEDHFHFDMATHRNGGTYCR